MAREETGRGIYEDKVLIKNMFVQNLSGIQSNMIKLQYHKAMMNKVIEIATPARNRLGGKLSVTNPTSTTYSKH